ncbi:MAG: tRNA uracil 4-sulfurtransferase ThiI [Christensenellales bacterium]|jgi:thiamine biosynthesis protein ThiI
MDNVIIVRYAEIHLKGLNKPYFEKALVNNISKVLSDIDGAVVKRGVSRIYVEGVDDSDIDKAFAALECVFGIHSFSPAVRIEQDIGKAAAVLADMVGHERKKFLQDTVPFRVEAKRADKRYPMKSMQMAAEVGSVILSRVEGIKVDLNHPAITAYLEMREMAYCYTQVINGPGGMPVGCNGSAMLLLSGGIDSPVAGCMIAKRGVALSAVHFESFPYTSEKALDKVLDLARIMTRYTGKITLHVIRFTDIQMKLYEKCPPDYLTVLMRRYMMRIAEEIAKKDGCLALVTGESVGQVASQTLESLAVTNDVASIPVLRPLIGMDKIEITEKAQIYDTYRTSILPFEDCCTVFVPKHPVTKPRKSEIEKTEANLDIDGMVKAAIENDKVTIIG